MVRLCERHNGAPIRAYISCILATVGLLRKREQRGCVSYKPASASRWAPMALFKPMDRTHSHIIHVLTFLKSFSGDETEWCDPGEEYGE